MLLKQSEQIFRNTPHAPVVKLVSMESYMKNYAFKNDGFKYEYDNGIIEKTKKTMNQHQNFIIQNLNDALIALCLHKIGAFSSELDQSLTPSKVRFPDLVFFTREQTRRAAEGEKVLSDFMLEIISDTDNINRVNNKMLDYFKAGVKLVWHIFPQQKMVYIFKSPRDITVCMEEDICFAAPVLPEFQISIADLFKK